MQRRANDAQIERLMRALRRVDGKAGLSDYGKQLAKKIAKRDKIEYRSAERRLQRYITTAGERRSYVKAPVAKQRELRQVARQTPYIPPALPTPIRERPIVPERAPERVPYEPEPEIEYERITERERGEFAPTDTYELRSIIAYHDGDTRETGKALGVSSRLLDLVSQGVEIGNQRDAVDVQRGVMDFYDELDDEDVQDIQDFGDLLHNLPDWEIEMILADMDSSETDFSDWIDAWRNDGMDLETDDSEYWELWREAYERAAA